MEVNEGVERARTNGTLTAASLMVSGPAAHDAIATGARSGGFTDFADP
jgi:hypothetical protein